MSIYSIYKRIIAIIIAINLMYTNISFAGTHIITNVNEFYEKSLIDINNHDDSITAIFKNTNANLLQQYVDYFWNKYGLARSYVSYPYYITYQEGNDAKLVWDLKYLETREQYEFVLSEVDRILSQLITADMDVYQKEKIIHDWIIKNVEYDDTLTRYTAYDALTGNKTTVCNGYALLANQMFNKAGIQSMIVIGQAAGGLHAWNLVNLEGNWYHVDLTWNDGKGDKVEYDYYNLRTEEIKVDHKIQSIIPVTSSIPFDELILNKVKGKELQYIDIIENVVFDKINNIDELAKYIYDNINQGKTKLNFVYYSKSALSSDLYKIKTLVPQIGKFTYSYKSHIRTANTGDCLVTLETTPVAANPTQLIGLKFRTSKIDVRKDSDINLNELLNIYPLGINQTNLNWTTSNPKIATVTNGIVKGIAPGNTTIKVTDAKNSKVYAQISIKVPVDVKGISTKTNDLKVNINSSFVPQVLFNPTNATYRTFKMVSSDSNVIEVVGGKLVAKAEGKASIMITSTDNPSATTTMTVAVIKPVKSITVNKTSTIIKVGQNESLEAMANPSEATDKTLLWTSSNTKVAVVDETGKVTAISPGTANIKVYSKSNPIVYKQIKITVPVNLKGINVKQNEVYVKIGTTYAPTITFNPTNATIKNVTYISDNTSVLEIVNGKPIAKAEGFANLTVTAQDGGHNVVIKVNIISNPLISLALNKTSTTLTVGGNESLTLKYNPTNASVKDVTWSSSNTSIVTVDSNGNVTAVGKGTATIKVISKQNPNISRTCTVYVK